ncbi:serine--tRNA ligase [Rickettsiaceae bacterium]|nr:serine--tRNA ligase [Rickettsiaceae bacterium]
MLDIKWIRKNTDDFKNLLKKRRIDVDVEQLLLSDEKKRQLTTLIQQFQQAKNAKSKRLASLRGKASKEFEILKRDVQHINEKLLELSGNFDDNDDFQSILDNIPNVLDDNVPYGTDESMNKLISEFKSPIDMPYAKEHFEIGKDLGMIDFEQTAKISGSRFVTLKGKLAKLERALINFMIDLHIDNGKFEEISSPVLVKPKAMYNVGQLPKFSDDSYSISDKDFRLIPTGEVTLTNMVADSILKHEDLPLRYVSYTECFRSEAGSAGKDTRGMIRNHQFGKVEMVTISTPDQSDNEHKNMLSSAELVLKKLDIPYRVMLLCSRDTGFSARKTFDIEVWLPGQGKYREIASVSNCGDFQARRMKARYKELGSDETCFVHTLNGSGLAVGRTMVAIIENYQNEDGSITIPEALRAYMGGESKITQS